MIKRFVYVEAPRSLVVHRLYKKGNPVEGDLTTCGIPISTTWKIVSPRNKEVCRKCEKAE